MCVYLFIFLFLLLTACMCVCINLSFLRRIKIYITDDHLATALLSESLLFSLLCDVAGIDGGKQ